MSSDRKHMDLRVLFFGVITILASVIELLAVATASPGASWVAAVVVAIISHALWSFVGLDSEQWSSRLIPAAASLTGVATGILLRLLQADIDPWTWGAVPAALLTSGMSMWVTPRKAPEICFQHQVRLRNVLRCPRCRQKFCGSSDCWDSRRMRCQRCRQNEVLLLNLEDEHWWTRSFRNRISSGNCMKCLSAAATRQVHECGQCHWQMCRRCWDLDNCRCPKCHWKPEGLPEALVLLLPPTRAVPSRMRNVVAGQSAQQH